MTRPIVIRKVAKRYRNTGRPKVARDMRLNIDVARVQAISPHPCKRCSEPILPGDIYTKAYFRERLHPVGRNRFVPETKDFHVECLPVPLRPLLRLLKL